MQFAGVDPSPPPVIDIPRQCMELLDLEKPAPAQHGELAKRGPFSVVSGVNVRLRTCRCFTRFFRNSNHHRARRPIDPQDSIAKAPFVP